jgi:hypothetical protein
MDCAVCLVELVSDIQYTPCIHGFHLACLQAWADSHAGSDVQCPTCKTDISMLFNQPIQNISSRHYVKTPVTPPLTPGDLVEPPKVKPKHKKKASQNIPGLAR